MFICDHWAIFRNCHSCGPLLSRELFPKAASQASSVEHEAENQRLKRELERMTEERDILKKAAAYFAKDAR